MKQHLIVTALAKDKPGLLGELASLAARYSCSIEASRMKVLGEHAVMTLFLSGTWDAIAKLENNIGSIEKKLGFTLTVQRSNVAPPSTENLLPYIIELMTIDKTGVIDELSGFFAAQGINISETTSNSFINQQGTQLSNLYMRVYIPANMQISDLRERFMLVCDELNIDAILEPERS